MNAPTTISEKNSLFFFMVRLTFAGRQKTDLFDRNRFEARNPPVEGGDDQPPVEGGDDTPAEESNNTVVIIIVVVAVVVIAAVVCVYFFVIKKKK
jgi:t-SNARE complex subunit (syntaxin)